MVTIIIPMWMVLLIAVFLGLSTINTILDLYLKYLKGKIKKLEKKLDDPEKLAQEIYNKTFR